MHTFAPKLRDQGKSRALLAALAFRPTDVHRTASPQVSRSAGGTVAAMILQLQHHIGNAAVQAMLAGRAHRYGTVAQRILAARGRGARLDRRARRRLERSYSVDLSAVRVHTDAEADTLARAVNARAFTSSSDIFFSRGTYTPSSTDGFSLLAHEVAHVVQQTRGSVPADHGGVLRISEPGDRGELMAERAAEEAVRGSSAGALLDVPASGSAATPLARSAVRSASRARKAGAQSRIEAARPKSSALARLSSGNAGGIVTIQRSPQPLVPLGDFSLMFNPSSSLDFTPPGAAAPTNQRVNDASSTATFTGIPRGSSGTVTLDVAMQWFRKAAPGPVPATCDLCEVLRKVLTIEIPVPRLPIPFFPKIPDIRIEPPAALVEQCRRLVRVDPEAIRPLLDEIEDAALDPCGRLLSLINASGLSFLCSLALSVIPGVVSAIFLLQQKVVRAVRTVRQALDACKKATPGGAPPAVGQLAGNARAIMTTTFVSDPAGQLVFSGLTPAPSQDGLGARLAIPVESLRTSIPSGGTLQQQPTLVTTTGAAGTQGRLFAVNLVVNPVPADADYDCSARFGPFRVGKAVFEDEDGQIRAIRDFFFGMHPKVRQDIEEGRGNLVITGRASKTDTQANNLKLGKKRADRVEAILRNFTGNTPKLRALSLGELGAQTVGCPDTPENPAKGAVCEDPNERRADVNANGTIREAGDIDPKCSGHLGEATPTGASNPVTEAEGPGTAASAALDQPTLQLFSQGEPVRRLQALLNQISGAGLSLDGDFGPLTQSAVRAFQAGAGLTPDGIVGPKTWSQLLSVSL
jgi:Domain of unknown function (DUF4157)/Putative peptidoglycan binding domain